MTDREKTQLRRAEPPVSREVQQTTRPLSLNGDQAAALRLQRQIGNRAAIKVMRAPVAGPTGKSIRERMADLAGGGMVDPKARSAKAQVDAQAQAKAQAELAKAQAAEKERLTAEAFRSSTFYYGTTGGSSVLKVFLDTLTAKLTAKLQADLKAKGKEDKWASVYYWPGERARPYVADRTGRGAMAASPATAKSSVSPAVPASPEIAPVVGEGEPAQMMDMYYGGEHHNLGQLRNPQIGAYVHEKMGYKGDYDQNKPGRDAYMETHSVGKHAGLEGWQFPQLSQPQDPKQDRNKAPDGTTNDYGNALFKHPDTGAPLSGTMAISRHIREGIKKYGGTLIFENMNVPNEGSFLNEATVRKGDTNREALELLPVLAASPGKSRVPFGAGTLVFYHGGKEKVPTQWLFRQNWAYGKPPLSAEAAKIAIADTNVFWSFPSGAGLQLAAERVTEQNRKAKAAAAAPPTTP